MTEHTDPRAAVAGAVKSLRTTLGWSQHDLGHRSGLTQSVISDIERGAVAGLPLATADRVLGALGARLVLSVAAPYLGDRERQRDPAHANIVAYVVARLRRAGWDTRTEVEVGGDRSRGWIDILACHAASRVMLVIEIKTEIHDFGQIERSLAWYEREAWASARRFGWRPLRQVGCLLLLAAEANDTRATANRASIDAGFPLRARHLAAIIEGEAGPQDPGRAIALLDPRSHRRTWCRALRIDGRRSPAPYADYADFMRSISSRLARRPRGWVSSPGGR